MLITVSNRSGSYALPFQPGQTLLDALRQAGLPSPLPAAAGAPAASAPSISPLQTGSGASAGRQTAAEDGMALRLLEEGPWPWSWKGSSILCPALRTRKRLAGASPATSGTTTVVCHLVELSTGRTAATLGEGNAQRPFGRR